MQTLASYFLLKIVLSRRQNSKPGVSFSQNTKEIYSFKTSTFMSIGVGGNHYRKCNGWKKWPLVTCKLTLRGIRILNLFRRPDKKLYLFTHLLDVNLLFNKNYMVGYLPVCQSSNDTQTTKSI